MTAFVKVTLAALLVVHLVNLVSASKNHLHKRARRQGDQRPAYTQQGTVHLHSSRVLSCYGLAQRRSVYTYPQTVYSVY